MAKHLRGVVERITYQNAENGYSVLRLQVKSFTDLITAEGITLHNVERTACKTNEKH